MKKELIVGFLLIFLVCNLTFISARTSFITGKLIDNQNNANITSDRILDTSEIYKSSAPAVVKILISADFHYYVPKIKDIDFSEYNRKIDYGQEANFTTDVKVIYDASQNMYDEWGIEYNEADYANDYGKGLSYGSGFLISPKGHILTNAHVAVINRSYEEYNLESSILYGMLQTIDSSYANGDYASDYDYAYDLASYNFMVKQLKVNITNIKIKVVVGIDNFEKGTYAKEYIPQIVSFEGDASEYVEEGLDWALLKIDETNLPFIYLGDSDEISIGSNIFLIGYPGISEEKITTSENALTETDPYLELRKDVEPTLSKGYVSYIRPISNGYKTFQIDTSLNGGNSGGPVLDSSGKAIGIATYGYSEYQGGNYNYAQRINDIKNKIANQVILPSIQSKGQTNNLETNTNTQNSKFNYSGAIFGAAILIAIIAALIIIFKSKFKIIIKKNSKA